MLEVRSLGKAFPLRHAARHSDRADPREEGKRFHALRQVDFTLREGVILGLLGANGAGKTTLMRILGTSLRPTSGSVTLFGNDIVKEAAEVRKRIGFLSGATGLYHRLNARELLTFYGQVYRLAPDALEARIATLFEELEIRDFAHRRIETLSAGMKQRVSIARSLLHSPRFIIFDEPTTGLDVPTAQVILTHIERCRDLGCTVIFSTHHMHEVEKLCDEVVLIHKGVTCFNGTVEEMKRTTHCSHLDDAYLTLTGEGPNPGVFTARSPQRSLRQPVEA
jgi:sodium transport system ATP-binding protein